MSQSQTTHPLPTPAIPITRGHLHPQHDSSSRIAPAGSRISFGDPAYVNKNLQGINIIGEERITMPNLSLGDSVQEMIRKADENKARSNQRIETKKFWLSKEMRRKR